MYSKILKDLDQIPDQQIQLTQTQKHSNQKKMNSVIVHPHSQNGTYFIQSHEDFYSQSQQKKQEQQYKHQQQYQNQQRYLRHQQQQQQQQQHIPTSSSPSSKIVKDVNEIHYGKSIAAAILIIILTSLIAFVCTIVYFYLPTVPVEFQYVSDNWNISPITKIYQTYDCTGKLINYPFEGSKEGCDCTSSTLPQAQRIVDAEVCSSVKTAAGCNKVSKIDAKVLNSWKSNGNAYAFCVERNTNFNYKQSDCTQDSSKIEVCGDNSSSSQLDDSSLYILCVPKGQACPIKQLSVTQVDSSYLQIGQSAFYYTTSNVDQQTHMISTQVSEGDGVCAMYKDTYYSQSIAFDYSLFLHSKTKCDRTQLDQRFTLIDSISQDAFLSANQLDTAIKNLPSYPYNLSQSKYYLLKQSYIPWKQLGSCRTIHMDTFVNASQYLESVRFVWFVCMIVNWVVVVLYGIICNWIRLQFNMRIKNVYIVGTVVVLGVQLVITCIAFVITLIYDDRISTMNDAQCSDAITNSLIHDFFHHQWQLYYFTVQIILFVLVLLLILVTFIFITTICKIKADKTTTRQEEHEQESVRQMVEQKQQDCILMDINSYSTDQRIMLMYTNRKRRMHRSNSDFLGIMIPSENDFIFDSHQIRLDNERENLRVISLKTKGGSLVSHFTKNGNLIYDRSNRLNYQQSRALRQKYSYMISRNQINVLRVPGKITKKTYITPKNEKQRMTQRKLKKQKIVLKRSNSIENNRNRSSLFNPLEPSEKRKYIHQDKISRRRRISFINNNTMYYYFLRYPSQYSHITAEQQRQQQLNYPSTYNINYYVNNSNDKKPLNNESDYIKSKPNENNFDNRQLHNPNSYRNNQLNDNNYNNIDKEYLPLRDQSKQEQKPYQNIIILNTIPIDKQSNANPRQTNLDNYNNTPPYNNQQSQNNNEHQNPGILSARLPHHYLDKPQQQEQNNRPSQITYINSQNPYDSNKQNPNQNYSPYLNNSNNNENLFDFNKPNKILQLQDQNKNKPINGEGLTILNSKPNLKLNKSPNKLNNSQPYLIRSFNSSLGVQSDNESEYPNPNRRLYKRGSLDQFDSQQQDERRIPDYKTRLRRIKSSIKVPNFPTPDYDNIKPKYLNLPQQKSKSKFDDSEFDSESRSRRSSSLLNPKNKYNPRSHSQIRNDQSLSNINYIDNSDNLKDYKNNQNKSPSKVHFRSDEEGDYKPNDDYNINKDGDNAMPKRAYYGLQQYPKYNQPKSSLNIEPRFANSKSNLLNVEEQNTVDSQRNRGRGNGLNPNQNIKRLANIDNLADEKQNKYSQNNMDNSVTRQGNNGISVLSTGSVLNYISLPQLNLLNVKGSNDNPNTNEQASQHIQ